LPAEYVVILNMSLNSVGISNIISSVFGIGKMGAAMVVVSVK